MSIPWQPISAGDKEEKEWASPSDYKVDLSTLSDRITRQAGMIERIRYAKSLDIICESPLPGDWQEMNIENLKEG
jgi:hypothetical protein